MTIRFIPDPDDEADCFLVQQECRECGESKTIGRLTWSTGTDCGWWLYLGDRRTRISKDAEDSPGRMQELARDIILNNHCRNWEEVLP